jgi:tetratricopeptide (TPR) repeat protein
MNTDLGELLKRAKLRDPVKAGGIVALVVSMVLFVLVVTAWLGAGQEQKGLEAEYIVTRDSIEQIQRVQESSPDILRGRIEEAKEQLEAALIDFPTDEQALAELSQYYQHANAFNTELVRMEAMLPSPDVEIEDAYAVDRFLLEFRGAFPDLLRFLGHVTDSPYRTFSFDDVLIRGDAEALAEVSLAVFYSSLAPGVESVSSLEEITPTVTASPLTGGMVDIAKLETSLQRALREENWIIAIALGQRILEQDPARGEVLEALYQAHLNWGRSLVSLGKTDEGKTQFLAALSLVPGDEQALSAIRDLEDAAPVQTPMPTGAAAGAAPTRTVAVGTVYVVRHGDSLWLIARRYKATVAEIVDVNDLPNANIYVGQKLLIPGQ